jgi:hypothetical protein
MEARTKARRASGVDRRLVLATAGALAFLGPRDASGQAPGATEERAAVTDPFIGAWELVRWTSADASGATTFPFGENAQGQVSYTASGRMSAHLMRPPADPADEPPQHLSYWGTFTVDAGAATVTHHVIGADRPNWIGSEQVRRFRFEGDDMLVLSLGRQDLTWRRIP